MRLRRSEPNSDPKPNVYRIAAEFVPVAQQFRSLFDHVVQIDECKTISLRHGDFLNGLAYAGLSNTTVFKNLRLFRAYGSKANAFIAAVRDATHLDFRFYEPYKALANPRDAMSHSLSGHFVAEGIQVPADEYAQTLAHLYEEWEAQTEVHQWE